MGQTLYKLPYSWEYLRWDLGALARSRGGGGLGLLLPPPGWVASPTRAASLVRELAESIAYAHGHESLVVEKGWWSRRICSGLDYAECVEAESLEEVPSRAGELLDAIIDGSEAQARLLPGMSMLRYYIDSRRGAVLYLGRSRGVVHA